MVFLNDIGHPSLADLGDDYADLETDPIKIAVLMCNLSEYNDELGDQVGIPIDSSVNELVDNKTRK